MSYEIFSICNYATSNNDCEYILEYSKIDGKNY